MVRGPRHHLKRINAPKHWMLTKLTGIFAPRPSGGPHKLRECIPLVLLLRNRMKVALTRREAIIIVTRRLIKVDGKIRRDPRYPLGFQDVLTIEKTGESFRLLFDPKGRFLLHKLSAEEATFKLAKVRQITKFLGRTMCYTECGRSIRFPHPELEAGDTIQLSLPEGRIQKFIKFSVGNLCTTTGGRNRGRIGVITSVEKHPGRESIVYIKDARGSTWSTLVSNVFVIGEGTDSLITIPKGKGIRYTVIEEREAKLKRAEGL